MRRLLVIAAVLALTPATALAGTLTATRCPSYDRECVASATYTAAPGERNDVIWVQDQDGTSVRDYGAPVTPGRGCVAVDPNAARCPAWDLRVALGDGDDRASPVSRSLGRIGIEGGPGDDLITGGERAGLLDGGEGADTLLGGVGDDLSAGGPGRDVIEGGDGADTVSYIDEPPVIVDLADPGPDGPPQAPDTLTGVERVYGGAGDDVLRGDAGPNLLQGGAGDDVVDGREGDDVLFGATGRDQVLGGTGDDELAADWAIDEGASRPTAEQPERTGDVLDCGDGSDIVTEQAGDILHSCERLELPLGILAPDFDPRPRLDGRSAVLRLRCSVVLRAGTRHGCRVRVTLSAGGRRLGSRIVRVKGQSDAVRVPARGRPDAVRVRLRYLGSVADQDDRSTTVYVYRF